MKSVPKGDLFPDARGAKPEIIPSQFLRGMRLIEERVPNFDCYPFNIPAVRGPGELAFHPRMTFFIGENGTGKSTLLEALAVKLGFNPEGGSRNFNFAIRNTHSVLADAIFVNRGYKRPTDNYFLRAESFYNLATAIEQAGVFSSYGGISLHAQSHGEAFLALLTQRLRGRGVYLFDEPEAALSPQRQLAVLTHLHALIRARSQIIIATHSPILLAYPDAAIYRLSSDGIERIDYEDTEHYQVTRDFLNNRARMLDLLLNGD